MAAFNQRSYFDPFPEVCVREFDRRFELARLAKEVAQVQRGGSRLMASHVNIDL